MHEFTGREQAVRLIRGGAGTAETARRLRVPVGTVSWWKHRDLAERGELPGRKRSPCAHCYGDDLNPPAYSYLLGLYLGDGHISHPKQHRTASLFIPCDDNWPGIMDAAETAMRQVFPTLTPCRVRRPGAHNIKVYSKHLTCYFPQHGPGKKHERLRGLIHSDGCRITNWATRTVGGVTKRYEYPRYFFTNTSTDIIGLFTATLDAVGVRWKASIPRPTGQVNISVARKDSVALMDAHIGPKY
ncbi:hypothetical protein BX285_2918 [Streptomyces sp. 1114.5]|uniref:helix-turn-helix domain-containing protein n=1 Tax=Streptomyces sp. 1114.5 TaxID=1938830 RepID=UPI000F201355|nr:helix-turn-helix domain-containing protein [Streptomyces sp. 1114.5]RKT18495.1 hypothetical protein BX285_2918 [Streptomyces sp. 1114.5]